LTVDEPQIMTLFYLARFVGVT